MCATTSLAHAEAQAVSVQVQVPCTEPTSERESGGKETMIATTSKDESQDTANSWGQSIAQSTEASHADRIPVGASRCTTGDLSSHLEREQETRSPRASPCEKSVATATVSSGPYFNNEHVSPIVDSASTTSSLKQQILVNGVSEEDQGDKDNCKKRKREDCCDSSSEDQTDGEDADSSPDHRSTEYSTECYGSPSSPSDALPPPRKRSRRTLYIEYWSRTDECKERKWDHLDEIADKYGCPEDHIFDTVLKNRTSFLEPNMFPYDTPSGIEHWTLWHVKELCHEEIKEYVEEWIDTNAPHVRRWNYDDNPERSIDIFHVHVYFQVAQGDTVLRDRKVEDLVHGSTIVPTPYAEDSVVTAFR